jgi:hypothetical protein
VYPGGALFVQFTRPKTADEIGLSLFRDKDFVTCPINALALAMMMTSLSERDIFTQIPRSSAPVDEDADWLNVPLRDLLNNDISANQGGWTNVQGNEQATLATKPLRVSKAGRKGMEQVWVEWRTYQPPLYGSNSPLTKHQKYEH